MNERDEQEFAEYFAARRDSARRTAYMMCGDWNRGDDLARAAFVAVHRNWTRIRDRAALDVYLRTRIARAAVGESWKPWRGDRRAGIVPEPHGAPRARSDEWAGDCADFVSTLRHIPPRQRAVLVLRYFEGLDVRAVAETLHCGEGDVKSQTARGLVKLRRAMGARVRARG